MKKVLIIQQMIPHYRVPVFNELAKQCNLTIAAETFENVDEYEFEKVNITLKNKSGFTLIKNFSFLDLDNYDAVIFLFNIRFLNLINLLLKRTRSFRLILWGIGVSSETGYDNSRKFDKIRYWAAKRADAVVFYSNDPISKYTDIGNVERQKLFIANNTLDLEAKLFREEKEYFLFVGTLKKYKRIDRLIEIYRQALLIDNNLPDLHIIGDGEYMQSLIDQIDKLDLGGKIVLHGAINDSVQLESFYKSAIASISPYQAGLSVLQSLSMGVPFICNDDAVTGGERFNIIDGYNGYLVKSEKEFSQLLVYLGRYPSKCEKLGKNAYNYFKNECSIGKMVGGFLQAINI